MSGEAGAGRSAGIATGPFSRPAAGSGSPVPGNLAAMEFHVEDHPDPLDIDVLETQIGHEASAAMGLGGEVNLAIFVRDAGRIVAGITG